MASNIQSILAQDHFLRQYKFNRNLTLNKNLTPLINNADLSPVAPQKDLTELAAMFMWRHVDNETFCPREESYGTDSIVYMKKYE